LPLLPVVVGGIAAAEALLSLYIGSDFAHEATTVTQLLLLGAFAACIAQVPFTVLQACSRSDLTAKRHAVQLVVYVPAVIGMTWQFGINGTAATWLLWAVSDAMLLFVMVRRSIALVVAPTPWIPVFLGGTVMLALAFMISNTFEGWSAIGAAGSLATLSAIFLWFILSDTEKHALKTIFGRNELPAIQG